MGEELTPKLVCSDRGQHRPVVLLEARGDPLPHEWWPARVGPDWLKCKYCKRNPRLNRDEVDQLVMAAAASPRGRLDVSYLDR